MRFWLKQGDRNPPLIVTLRDSTGAIVDTTTLDTVKFNMRRRSTGNIKLDNATASFLEPRTSGQVQYDWAAGDTDTPGEYDAEFEVIDAGESQTFPGDTFIEVVISPSIDDGTIDAQGIYELRRATGEVGDTMFLDTELERALNRRDGELNAAAYDVWSWKLAEYANLVNVQEGGSNRSLSDLFDHAQKMIDFYGARSTTIIGEITTAVGSRARTRRIVRE